MKSMHFNVPTYSTARTRDTKMVNFNFPCLIASAQRRKRTRNRLLKKTKTKRSHSHHSFINVWIFLFIYPFVCVLINSRCCLLSPQLSSYVQVISHKTDLFLLASNAGEKTRNQYGGLFVQTAYWRKLFIKPSSVATFVGFFTLSLSLHI